MGNDKRTDTVDLKIISFILCCEANKPKHDIFAHSGIIWLQNVPFR